MKKDSWEAYVGKDMVVTIDLPDSVNYDLIDLLLIACRIDDQLFCDDCRERRTTWETEK